jgi:putative membrane protein
LNIYHFGDRIFDILAACLIGVLCGVVTGIIPGIHVNTVGAFIFASSAYLLNFVSADFLAVFLISMSISHSMIDFLLSMFLGVLEAGTVLSVLPAHHFMLMGRGRKAVRMVTIGGFGSLIVTVVLLPIFAITTTHILANKTIYLFNSSSSSCVYDQTTK